MKDTDDKQQGLARFQPPRLPIPQLIATFIAPVIVAIVPPLFSRDEVSATMCVIFALALLSVLLFVFAIVVILKLYDEAYTRQVVTLSQNAMRQIIDKIEEENAKLRSDADSLSERITSAEVRAAAIQESLNTLANSEKDT